MKKPIFSYGYFLGRRCHFEKEKINWVKGEIEKMPKELLTKFALQNYIALEKLMDECGIAKCDRIDFRCNVNDGIYEAMEIKNENNTRNS